MEETMIFFGLANCDTCRRALRELRAAGVDPEIVDVRRDGMSAAQISAIVDHLGERAINKRSKTWRDLNEAARAMAPEALIARHPAVMKRPVIKQGPRYVAGWDEAARAALL